MLCGYCQKRPIAAKNLCGACYYRQRRTGTLEYQKKPYKRQCKFECCSKIAVSRGFCDTHRKRIERHGDVHKGRPDWWGRPFNRRRSDLKRKYGLPYDAYLQMGESQEHKCAICRRPKPLVVDHCHRTQIVRGLLCRQCNLWLGLIDDSIQSLKAAIAYLQK